MKAAAILLAAGQSTRMGFLKGLLPWQGKTLFEHQLQVLKASNLSQIVIVTGCESERFLKLAANYDVQTVLNPTYMNGKCSSILTGLRNINNDAEAVFIAAVDQPTDPLIIKKLIKTIQMTDSSIVVPVYGGKRGHPALFSTKIMSDLLSIQEETKGLRSLFQKHKVIEIPINHSLIELNINTPSDYQNALNLNNKKEGQNAHFRN
jgi:molybdenum cofactor cytidylyltransferase